MSENRAPTGDEPRTVGQMAKLAADAIMERAPAPDEILRHEWLREVGAFPPKPQRGTFAEISSWTQGYFHFTQAWMLDVEVRTGRVAENVRGEGYRLLGVESVAEAAEAGVYAATGKATREGHRKIRHALAAGLSPEGQQEAIAASNRIGGIADMIRAYEARARKEAEHNARKTNVVTTEKSWTR